MKRYALRFGTTRIPMVEVTTPETIRHYVGDRPVTSTADRVVHKAYGFTTQHAYRRALSWARENGDPR